MAVSAEYKLRLDVTETISPTEELMQNFDVKHTIGSDSGTLNASSTPPATKAWSDTRALTGGADSIDLTALVRTELANVDFTGLKVQLVKIRAAAANTDTLRVKVGAINPYNIFGDANGEITLDAGEQVLFQFADNLPDVAAGAKEVDFSSSDADANYDILLVAG